MMPLANHVPIPKNGVDYRGKVVLAPMVRAGTLPTRILSLRYGADLVWGPETVDRSMIGTTRRVNPVTKTIEFTRPPSHSTKDAQGEVRESVIFRIHPELESRKLIFQIGTASPETAVQASKVVARDVAGIDVNAGCPKPFSTTGGMGAALLEVPDLLCSILRSLVKEVGAVYEIGISVKIRLLKSLERTEALVRALCQTGIVGLTIHCRTPDMRPRQRVLREHLSALAEICREAGVACLMNGDVDSREQALALIKEYRLDGAMIARGAESNPSCFRLTKDGGLVAWLPLAQEYLRIAMEVDNNFSNSKWMLAKLIPGKSPLYIGAQKSKDYKTLCSVLETPALLELAQAVDIRIGLSPMAQSATSEDKSGNIVGSISAAGRKRKRVETEEETAELNSDLIDGRQLLKASAATATATE